MQAMIQELHIRQDRGSASSSGQRSRLHPGLGGGGSANVIPSPLRH